MRFIANTTTSVSRSTWTYNNSHTIANAGIIWLSLVLPFDGGFTVWFVYTGHIGNEIPTQCYVTLRKTTL